MKKLYLVIFAAIIGATALFSSCSYNPSTPTPATGLQFKKDSTAHYNIFTVDTSGGLHNADSLLTSTLRQVEDIVISTGLTYQGKTSVVQIKTFQGATATDSAYFYQDPNGDLYRYNYGFSILNQFPYLVQAVGHPIDVGWVLAAKIASATGTTWQAAQVFDTIQGFNLVVNLQSQGQSMADTTILVGQESVKVHHAHTTITALVIGTNETGAGSTDSYYSTDINAVVEDFFRHVKLTGQVLTQQAQGQFKIMTSHN